MFNKGEGRHIQLVVSASRSLTEMPRREVIDLAAEGTEGILPASRRSEARTGARRKGSTGDVLQPPRAWKSTARQHYDHPESLPGRRLDPLRLARNHGRRSAQRLPSGGSGS